MPASIESLKARHDAVAHMYDDNIDMVHTVQDDAINRLLPEVAIELELSEEQQTQARAFIADQGKHPRHHAFDNPWLTRLSVQ